jgi:elongation factor P--beta-lysine ligase
MQANLEYLNAPETVIAIILAFLVISNVIGEILEFKGKVVPEFIKMRKYFNRRKKERKAISKMAEMYKDFQDVPTTLEEVKTLLNNVDKHYSADNITMRNDWMKWVNNQATVYDTTLADLEKKMDENNEITLSLLIESKRNTIIDFASKVIDKDYPVTREQFNRIFKIYSEYETIIEEKNMTNGEVDIAIRIINESYELHMKNHTFVEDVRGY